MGWTTPKTDWTAVDYFNLEDYHRIRDNLVALYQQSLGRWPPYELTSQGPDKTYQDYYYADEFNAMEEALNQINEGTFSFDLGESAYFYENGPFIDAAELNRLERGLLQLHEAVRAHEESLPRLPISLGRVKI